MALLSGVCNSWNHFLQSRHVLTDLSLVQLSRVRVVVSRNLKLKIRAGPAIGEDAM